MNTIELLISAIKQKRQISYEYHLQGRAEGVRIGNPHAIFEATSGNINIDIFKIDGVRTEPQKPLPEWRQYTVKHLRNVVILDEVFSIADGYNTYSNQYTKVIFKL